MTEPTEFVRQDLRGARFRGSDLTGAQFRGCDLNGVVMRAVDVFGAEIDAPWLLEEPGALIVNGVDVAPLVDGELDRRFPGRELRRSEDPDGLRQAWAAVERQWARTLERAAAMPTGTVEESVDGEWSFSQTLRHLVMATDTWYRKAIEGIEAPYHPIGQPDASFGADGEDEAVFAITDPVFEDVLAARAERVAMVREFLAGVTAEQLAEQRPNPHAPQYPETVLSCVRTILEEEWEHHRFAVRDLDVIAARA